MTSAGFKLIFIEHIDRGDEFGLSQEEIEVKEKPYQIDFSWDDDILTIAINGQSYGSSAEEIAQEVTRIAEENKPKRVLIDCRKVVGRLGFSSTFSQVKKYHSVHKYIPLRTAVLELEENEGTFTFHEMAARNTGLNMSFFTKIEDALESLKK